jgi:hypothetical protein
MDGHSVLLVLLLHSIAAVNAETTTYTEGGVNNSRQYISLGGLFPIRRNNDSGCGELREAGVERAEAMVYAIQTINSDPFLLPGVNLTYDIRDTCSLSNFALERAIEYVQSSDTSCSNQSTLSVSGILGASSSSVSTSVAGLFRLFQLPQISYSSSAATLSDRVMFDYFFRTVPSDAFQAKVMADLIVYFNWTYIFALYSDNTYGREGIVSLITELTLRNESQRCIALRAALPLGSSDEPVFDEVVNGMRQEWVRNATVAVLFGHRDEAVGMMSAIMRAGDSNLQDLVWIASDSWATTLDKEYHKAAKGMLGVLPHPGLIQGFRNYFIGLNPQNNRTTNPWFKDFWESVFDCKLEGIQPCDLQTQNLSIRNTNSKASNVIDAVYAFAHAAHQMIADHCKGETVCDEIVTRRSIGEAINGTLLRQYLFNVSFNSTFAESSGEQLFDVNGDVQGSYLIVNLQLVGDKPSFTNVGTWNHDHLELTAPIQWPDYGENPPQSVCSLPCEVGHEPRRLHDQEACCWECKACLGENLASSGGVCFECGDKEMPNPDKSDCIEIPLTFFTASSPWAIVILLLTSVGIAATVFVAVMSALFYRKKVIKASSRELSAILLAGIFLCYMLPFLFVVRPSPVVCGLRRFAIGFCFAICYSALLVRSNRIHRIFNQPPTKVSNPPRFIGALSQVIIMSFLICIQVLIAVVWLAVEPPSVETVQVNSRTVDLRCGESPYYGLPVSLAYNLFLLILSTYFAFQTRKVPDNFNEAKFINITMYSLCIIWLGFLPAYFVSVQFGTEYESFFLLLAIILSASTTLMCLLMPKIFIILLNKSEKDSKETVTSNFTTVQITER